MFSNKLVMFIVCLVCWGGAKNSTIVHLAALITADGCKVYQWLGVRPQRQTSLLYSYITRYFLFSNQIQEGLN